MKPTKNRYYCRECMKYKMLFDTESKANTFIKFNGNEISNNPETLRSYYCVICGGWHISSKPKKQGYGKHVNNTISVYRTDYSSIYRVLDELKDYNPTFDKQLTIKFFNTYYPEINQRTKAQIISKYYDKKIA